MSQFHSYWNKTDLLRERYTEREGDGRDMCLGVGNYDFKVFFDAPVRIADLDLQQKGKKSMNWVSLLFFIHHSSVSPTQLPPSSEKQKGEEKKKSKSWTKKRAMNFSTASWSRNKKSEIQTLYKLELRRYWKKKRKFPSSCLRKKKASPPSPSLLLLQHQLCPKSLKICLSLKHTKKRELLLND